LDIIAQQKKKGGVAEATPKELGGFRQEQAAE